MENSHKYYGVSVKDRFMSHVSPKPNSSCWLGTGENLAVDARGCRQCAICNKCRSDRAYLLLTIRQKLKKDGV